MMMRNLFEPKDAGEELDPQLAESEQLAMLGMHEASEEEEKELNEEKADDEKDEEEDGQADPSDDLDKDGLEELDEMEKQLRLEENPILDFATVEEE